MIFSAQKFPQGKILDRTMLGRFRGGNCSLVISFNVQPNGNRSAVGKFLSLPWFHGKAYSLSNFWVFRPLVRFFNKNDFRNPWKMQNVLGLLLKTGAQVTYCVQVYRLRLNGAAFTYWSVEFRPGHGFSSFVETLAAEGKVCLFY